MKKIKYAHYCVAFLDILGFKNLVGTEDASTIHSIFNNIRYAKKLIRGVPGEDTWWEQIGKKTKIYFFSDSIVIAIPMSEPMALELVASNCMLLQHTLWYYGLPTWIRGGIAIGDLYCGNSEIFGPALIDAYMLEGTVAKYPRIVMHESTYQTGIDNTDNKQDIIFNAYRLNSASSAEYTRQRYVILSDRRKSQIFGGSRRIFAPIYLHRSRSCEDYDSLRAALSGGCSLARACGRSLRLR